MMLTMLTMLTILMMLTMLTMLRMLAMLMMLTMTPDAILKVGEQSTSCTHSGQKVILRAAPQSLFAAPQSL